MLTHSHKIFDGVLRHRMRLELRKQESADGRVQDLELVPRDGTCHGGPPASGSGPVMSLRV